MVGVIQRSLVCWLVSALMAISMAHAKDRIAPPLDSQAKIKHSDHSAEVLWSNTHTHIQKDHHWQSTSYFSIRLNDLEAARDYGRISYPFNHYYSETTLDFANVRSTDGTISSVSKDAVQVRVTGGGQDFYSDSSEYVFSLPDIAPGSIIEFQFSTKSKELPLPGLYSDRIAPYWFQRTVGGESWRVDFVKHHEYKLTSPVDLQIHQKAYKQYPAKAKRTKQKNQYTRVWSGSNFPSFPSEAWMPAFRKVAPSLHISTHKDWSVVTQWSWNNAKDKIAPTESLKRIVEGFDLPEEATLQDKTRAVYQYLQTNVRYVFAHLGRGGYEPHFADKVVEASYGDCKDQTILGVALLRLLGIDAWPALVETPRSGNHDTELVSLFFDHMIIYVPAQDNQPAIWMDTTGDRSLYPGMSNYLEGQTALILDEDAGTLTQVKDVFSENSAVLVLDYRQNQNNQSVVKATIELSGYIEQNTRSWWIHNQNRESELDKFVKSIFTNTTSYEVTSSLKHADDLWKPVRIEAEFIFKPEEDSSTPPLYGAGFAQAFRLFGHFNELQLPDTREHPFVDNYAFSIGVRATFNGAKNVTPTLVQSSGDVKSKFISIEQKGSRDGNNYLFEATMSKPKLNLTVDEYKTYYDALEEMTQLNAWLVSMQIDKKAESNESLAELKAKTDDQGLAYLMALARSQIEKGQYQQALSNAEKAVELDKNNGEAWYILGMSQGFNTLVEESNASFERAAALGYLP